MRGVCFLMMRYQVSRRTQKTRVCTKGKGGRNGQSALYCEHSYRSARVGKHKLIDLWYLYGGPGREEGCEGGSPGESIHVRGVSFLNRISIIRSSLNTLRESLSRVVFGVLTS